LKNEEYYVDKHDKEEIKFGLEKIYKLLEVLGNPQDYLKVIHVAGTNGKGSVSSYLSYIMAYQGMKVGKLSSPVVFSKMEFAQIYELNSKNRLKDNDKLEDDYLKDCCSVQEQFKKDYIDKEQIEMDESVLITDAQEVIFNIMVEQYKNYIDEIQPSGYEIQVAFSLKYFLENQCDIIIVEVGMGGSGDATNVFKHTLCDVITSISLDHVGIIGDTIEDIACCKCGIISHGGHVVTTSSNDSIMDIIKEKCLEKNAQLYVANMEQVTQVQLNLDDNKFMYGDSCNGTVNESNELINDKLMLHKSEKIELPYDNNSNYSISMNGKHQIENAIIAIEVIHVLNKQGYKITEASLKKGLFGARQKGRFDVIKHKLEDSKIVILADGAHNEAGARCLVQGMEDYFDCKNSRIIYVMSVFKDKDYKEIINQFLTNADEIWAFSTENPRSLDCDVLCETIAKQGLDNDKSNKNIDFNKKQCTIRKMRSINNVIDEVSNLDRDTIIVFAGSLSFMKDIYGGLKWIKRR